ncbi:MAG TPA: CHAP domain-containing protein [Acidimicrobiia bacterium]|nr:CHAP domain-containing protein [Acidimicrobiia bacterium]
MIAVRKYVLAGMTSLVLTAVPASVAGAVPHAAQLPATLRIASATQEVVNDYPWANQPQDGGNDPWSYPFRECTSFVAWRLHIRNHFEMDRFVGNANRWADWGRGRGFAVDEHPTPGSIAQTRNGTFGHVAWVTRVDPNGTVWVEDYNFQLTGQYLVHALGAGFVFIHVPDNTQRLGGPS